jgi:hypothetical protein
VSEWFAPPVLFVADVARSVDFYVNQLGFTRAWCYEEEGKAFVAQVDRQGCALILSSQWSKKWAAALIKNGPYRCYLSALVGAAAFEVRWISEDGLLPRRDPPGPVGARGTLSEPTAALAGRAGLSVQCQISTTASTNPATVAAIRKTLSA